MLKFQQKLEDRINRGSERSLSLFSEAIDFFSNDYLGLSHRCEKQWIDPAGSSGSRLISGNSTEAENTEKWLAAFFESESTLVFNSGYDANLGFFSLSQLSLNQIQDALKKVVEGVRRRRSS